MPWSTRRRGRAAGLHDDPIDRAIGEESLELAAGQTVVLNGLARAVGKGHLVDILCEIDSGSCRIHLGLLP